MAVLDASGVAKELSDFIRDGKNAVLFAGAGVGARAGLKDWPQLMDHLAAVARTYNVKAGDLIADYAEEESYLAAADTYRACPQIPEGERYHRLAEPFTETKDWSQLRALVSLPFCAIVTTNYDRSLHDAYADIMHRAPPTVELQDPTMKSAPFNNQFYIARIHGRAEVPQTMVIASEDCRRTQGDEFYVDFLLHVLTDRRCLFIGFSFMDPGIDLILRTLTERLAPSFPSLHCAFLSAGASPKLCSRLASANIKACIYEKSTDHQALWHGVLLASREFTQEQKICKPEAEPALQATHRFLAAAYARVVMGDDLQPLFDMVVDGMIMNVLAEGGTRAVSLDEVAARLREVLRIPLDESRRLASSRAEALSHRDACIVSQGSVRATRDITQALQDALRVLVDGVVDRAVVRETTSISQPARTVLARCIEDTLVARGWDLGAHYAGAQFDDPPNVSDTVQRAFAGYAHVLTQREREPLVRALLDLLEQPNEAESKVLAELGRVAFGLQLTLNSPGALLAHRATLPERVYLDASVLMPATVDGHPYQPAYQDCLARLRDAATAAGAHVEVTVASGFLSEVIHHRRLACQDVEVLSLEDPGQLRRYIEFWGAPAVNVFVGAYQSWVGRVEEHISFSEFLHKAADYRNEKELSNYLRDQHGIDTLAASSDSVQEERIYADIQHRLTTAYQLDTSRSLGHAYKPQVLIDNEARQLTRLVLDLKSGARAIFVTADKRLRGLAPRCVSSEVAGAIVSNVGFMQLIDVLVGLRGDAVSVTRLLWGGALGSTEERLRHLLINLALRHYDEALMQNAPAILEELLPEAVAAAEGDTAFSFPSGSTQSKARAAKHLDRFENEFYARMSELYRRKYPGEYNPAEAASRKNIDQMISSLTARILGLEERVAQPVEPEEKSLYEGVLRELREQLDYFVSKRAGLD